VCFDQTQANPVPEVILFQYNPESLTRSLQPQAAAAPTESATSEPFRLKGPPVETINLDLELDATDMLEHPDQNQDTVSMGIHPQIAALEKTLYPKSSEVISNAGLASQGTLEIAAPEGPFTIFVWGQKRVLPVRITEFRITEEAYDPNLNPIRAKVSLGMRVLSYADLVSTHPGYSLFLAHQMDKESIASRVIVNGLNAAGVKSIKLS
jgi:hypothetical protein